MKENIDQKLNEKAESLRKLISKRKGAVELLDEVLDLSRQASIIPVEIEIPADSVIKRYPISEALEIVRCKTAIFFHSTCFWVISKPTLANNMQGGALFEMLTWYCDFMDKRDSMPDDEDRLVYDAVCAQIANILSLPLDVFTDVSLMMNVSNYILKARNIYYEHLVKLAEEGHEDTISDIIDNQLFEEQVRISEEFKSELANQKIVS